jgi:tetratricopeptide (TPR) repeat protein
MKSYQNTTIPLEAQYLYRRGREMIDQQNETAALVFLKQAVFIAPGFLKAYQELGDCLARLGRVQEASVYLVKASRIDPNRSAEAADTRILREQGEDGSISGTLMSCLVW